MKTRLPSLLIKTGIPFLYSFPSIVISCVALNKELFTLIPSALLKMSLIEYVFKLFSYSCILLLNSLSALVLFLTERESYPISLFALLTI